MESAVMQPRHNATTPSMYPCLLASFSWTLAESFCSTEDWVRCRYEAFKTIGEKKACFNEYLQQRAREEKEESRTRAKQNRDNFFTLLELSPELKTGIRYSKAAAMFDDEPRWKVSPRCPKP